MSSTVMQLPPAGATVVPVWQQRRDAPLSPPRWLAHAARHAERRFETPFDANGNFDDLVALRYVYVRAHEPRYYYAAPYEAFAVQDADARLVWCAESGHVGVWPFGRSREVASAAAKKLRSVRGIHVRAIREAGDATAVFEAYAAAMRAIISTRGPDAGGWRGLHMAKTRVTFGRGPDVRAGAGTGHRPARMSRWEGAPPTLRSGPVGGSAFFP